MKSVYLRKGKDDRLSNEMSVWWWHGD